LAVTVTLAQQTEATPSLVSTSTVAFVVQPSDLVARIAGGDRTFWFVLSHINMHDFLFLNLLCTLHYRKCTRVFAFRIVETRAASAAPAVTLDASLSFDPDVSDGPDIGGSGSASSPLSYLWVCAPASECPALFSSGAATSQSGSPVFSMPASLFVGGAAETVPLRPVLL
jgi:hypothetical protein